MRSHSIAVYNGPVIAIFIVLISAFFLLLIYIEGLYEKPWIFWFIPAGIFVLGSLAYLLSLEKIVLSYNETDFNISWVKKTINSNTNINASFSDVKIVVLAENSTEDDVKIERFFTSRKEIYYFPLARKHELAGFSGKLLSSVDENNGAVITSYAFRTVLQNSNSSFYFLILSFLLCVVLIPSMWEYIGAQALYFLAIPLITFVIHKLIRLNNPLPENIGDYYLKAINRDKIDDLPSSEMQ